jgi:ABC-type glycerol-3-phosphate transport system substrate-binding protein
MRKCLSFALSLLLILGLGACGKSNIDIAGEGGGTADSLENTAEPTKPSGGIALSEPLELDLEFDSFGEAFAGHEYTLPLTAEPVELRVLADKATGAEYSDEFLSKIAVATGIKLTYTYVSADELESTYRAAVGTDNAFDVVCGVLSSLTLDSNVTLDEFMVDWGFVDASSRLRQMPNYGNILRTGYLYDENNLGARATAIGVYGSAPVMGLLKTPETYGYIIREDLLEKHGTTASDIKTYDDFIAALEILKFEGIERPLELYNTLEYVDGQLLAGMGTGAYSDGTYVYMSDHNRGDDGDHDLEYNLTGEYGYKAVAWLHNLYEQGLLGDGFADAGILNTMTSKVLSGSVGCFGGYDGLTVSLITPITEAQGWKFAPVPRLKESEGDNILYGRRYNYYVQTGGWYIADGANADAAIRLADWLYSDAGSKLWNGIGFEGASLSGNSVVSERDAGLQLYEREALHDALTGVNSADFKLAAFDAWTLDEYDFADGYQFDPLITFTMLDDVEVTKMTKIERVLAAHIDTEVRKFILGERDLSEWSDYMLELGELGLWEAHAYRQTAAKETAESRFDSMKTQQIENAESAAQTAERVKAADGALTYISGDFAVPELPDLTISIDKVHSKGYKGTTLFDSTLDCYVYYVAADAHIKFNRDVEISVIDLSTTVYTTTVVKVPANVSISSSKINAGSIFYDGGYVNFCIATDPTFVDGAKIADWDITETLADCCETTFTESDCCEAEPKLEDDCCE